MLREELELERLEAVSISFLIIELCASLLFFIAGIFFGDSLLLTIGGIVLITLLIHIKIHKNKFTKGEQDEN